MQLGYRSQQKYTDSNSFKKRCAAVSEAIANANDVEVTEYEGNPMLTIANKSFIAPFSFGLSKARLFIRNLEKIKAFAEGDISRVLSFDTGFGTVNISGLNCTRIVKYETVIRLFIDNPNFLQA